MLDVNLVTEKQKGFQMGKNFRIAILIFISVLAILGLLHAAKYYLSIKIQDVISQNDAQYGIFLSGKGSDVIDFKNRSIISKSLSLNVKPTNEILGEIEKNIMTSVYLNSLKYSRAKNEIELSCLGDNYNTVAKQVLNFKESGDYLSVVLGDIVFDNDVKKLNFSIRLALK